ncbi:hypothetical protein GGX14DRAFT_575722 [Mycena pura]|uniref:DUF6534 domain-containing protein n=1 Tax=Mycena pura TaxID=153505 RepID=A0AAD6UV31_9AGAR|nr:hypothetical protein GGX14DRAFT_575722 [Mycena pura]
MSDAVFDPNPTLGALLVGVLASCILFGVSTTQVYIYSTRFPEDKWFTKALVRSTSFTHPREFTSKTRRLLEVGHLICVAHTLYLWVIIDYGHPERLLGPLPVSTSLYVLITTIIDNIVDSFFGYRIYVLSERRSLPYFIWFLSFARLCLGIVAFGVGFNVSSLQDWINKFNRLAIAGWSISAGDQMLIMVSLVYLLWSQRDIGTRKTTALVDKIVLWTVETGVMTSTFSLGTLICYHLMPDNLIWTGLLMVEARVFSNALLARSKVHFIIGHKLTFNPSLNSRTMLRDINSREQLLSLPSHFVSDSKDIASVELNRFRQASAQARVTDSEAEPATSEQHELKVSKHEVL